MKAEQKSLTSQFETIDALINQSQMDLAVKSLKKIEKKAHDSWSNIAVFKRYILLGEKERADLLLKKALKKNSENLELLAVYSNFLIKENRFDEAENYAKKLCGTKYSSLYSELILKKAVINTFNKRNTTYDINLFRETLEILESSDTLKNVFMDYQSKLVYPQKVEYKKTIEALNLIIDILSK